MRPIVGIYSYKTSDYSSFGLFDLELTLDIGMISCHGRVDVMVEGDCVGGLDFSDIKKPYQVGRVTSILLNGGWFQRCYEIVVTYQGKIYSALSLNIHPDRTISYADGSQQYYKYLRSLMSQPSKGCDWDCYIQRYYGLGYNRNSSGLHHLLVLYSMSRTMKQHYNELASLLKYFFDLVHPDIDPSSLEHLIDKRYSSNDPCSDLLKELAYPIRQGYVSIDTVTEKVHQLQSLLSKI